MSLLYLDTAIENFATTISKQVLGHVYHRPDPASYPTYCINNVLGYIQINGGRIRYGWTFHYRTNEDFGDYLFATHHAVWQGLDGYLIDVTPFHQDVKHHPITNDGSIVFLVDDLAQPLKKDNKIIPLPLKFFAIQNDAELEKYLDRLRKKEMRDYIDNHGIYIT